MLRFGDNFNMGAYVDDKMVGLITVFKDSLIQPLCDKCAFIAFIEVLDDFLKQSSEFSFDEVLDGLSNTTLAQSFNVWFKKLGVKEFELTKERL